jgi:hypothetical protein
MVARAAAKVAHDLQVRRPTVDPDDQVAIGVDLDRGTADRSLMPTA